MKIIAHRGNLGGPNPGRENHPDYIAKAMYQGFDVEIDVWCIGNKFFLGHDAPQYDVKESYLLNSKFWQHAKNIEAFYRLNRMKPNYLINCFSHNIDDAVLTSGGWLWTYPGKEITPDSIAVMPERVPGWDISQSMGVCTDYPYNYKP